MKVLRSFLTHPHFAAHLPHQWQILKTPMTVDTMIKYSTIFTLYITILIHFYYYYRMMILTHLKVSRKKLEEVSSSLILMPLSMLYNMLLICLGDDLGPSLTNSDTHAAATCITGNG